MCRAVGLSSMVLVSGIAVIHGFVGYSRSVFLIDGVLALLFTGGLRLLIRFMFTELALHRDGGTTFHFFKRRRDHKRILIYGAGSASEKLFRKIAENPWNWTPTKSPGISMTRSSWSPGPGAASAVSCAARLSNFSPGSWCFWTCPSRIYTASRWS
ncbi:uncharacteroized protein [Desulfobacula toluolica Tol2]|uniref:Uncharacteroized protein n=1 Tax=Desulfobacula toluolica (strain DSM 7467 / Tol2) TaxID=651182 RepID=K0N4C7_DESTT|nr:uncharacteroized protein [Desulfobacula toluolica Tol2]